MSSNTSRFEALAGLFRWLKKGIFDAYLCTVTFREKNIFEFVTRVSTGDTTIRIVIKNQCLFQFFNDYKFGKARNSTLIMKHISTPK